MVARRRRRAIAGLVLSVVAVAGAAAFYVARDSTSDPVIPPEDSQGLVVAVRPNNPSFVTVDLMGNVQTYGPSDHLLPLDAVSGVVISRSGDVIVSIGTRVFVVEDADFTRPPIELGPLEFDRIRGVANEVYAAPTQDGSAVWIVLPASQTVSGERRDTTAYLVAADGSSVLSLVQGPRRLRPVGVTAGAKLVVHSRDDAGGDEVLTVAESGEIALVGSGVPIGVGRNHIVLIADDGDLVAISDTGELRVPVPVAGGKWSATGRPHNLAVAIPSPTVTDDGRILVEAVGEGIQPSFYVVDAGSADQPPTPIPTSYTPASHFLDVSYLLDVAAWTDNGNSVILMEPHRVKILDLSGDGTVEVLHEFDSEHFVYAAH